MNNSTIKKPELPFTVSSIFFIIITMLKLFSNYILPEMFGGAHYVSAESTIYMAVTFVLAIFLIIKRFFVVNTIFIGILAAFESYWLISYLSDGYSDILYFISSLCASVSWILIFIISIGAATKSSFKGIGKVWFVPVLLQFTVLPVSLYNYLNSIIYQITVIDYYDSFSLWIIRSVLSLILYIMNIIAFTLLCKWYGRVIGDQRQALEADYSEPAYAQPVCVQPVYEQPVYAQPAQEQPIYAEPAQPIQPDNTDRDASDLAAELEKYKNLYEKGLITQDEYRAKRAQLLNL